jgi:tetratricopeptide (TPR) repeat protein
LPSILRFTAGAAAAWLCVLLAGCAATARFPNVRPVERHSKAWFAQRRAEDYFIKAREFERRGLVQMAIRYYEAAHELDTGAVALRNALVQRYLLLEKFNQALSCIKGQKKETELSDSDKSLCATIYMRMGRLARAAEMLETVTEKSRETRYMLGVVYESMGSLPKAISNYKAILDKDTTSVDLVIRVSALYGRLRNWAAAESLLVTASGNTGKEPRLYNAIGEIKLAKGDTALGLDFFKMAAVIDSDFVDAARNIAQVYIRRGDWASAIPYYERLEASDSGGEMFGRTLAMLYYYGNKYEKAKALLRSMLAADIEDYELHFYLGLSYAAQDSADLSRTEFEKTLVIRPDFAEAWMQLAYLDIKVKDVDEALADAKRFAKALPASPAAWRTLGYVYNVRKEFKNALPQLRKAVDMDTLDAFALYELGSALERTGDIISSAVAFRRVLRLKPEDASAANYMGYMWADKGIKLDSAKVLIAWALGRDTANGAYLDSYAWVLYRLGKIDSALVYIEKAIKLINDDATVTCHYADILLASGRSREALDAFGKSLELDAKSDESEHVRKMIAELEAKLGIQPDQKEPVK